MEKLNQYEIFVRNIFKYHQSSMYICELDDQEWELIPELIKDQIIDNKSLYKEYINSDKYKKMVDSQLSYLDIDEPEECDPPVIYTKADHADGDIGRVLFNTNHYLRFILNKYNIKSSIRKEQPQQGGSPLALGSPIALF